MGEWGRNPDEKQRFQEERSAATERIASELTRSEEPPTLKNWFLEQPDLFADDRSRIKGSMAEEWKNALSESGPHYVFLDVVKRDIYQPPAVRLEAKRLAENPVLAAEFAIAIGLAARQPGAWAWPEEGVSSQVLWTRNKWRLYLRQALPDAAIIDYYGRLIGHAYEKTFADRPRWLGRKGRLLKLLQLRTPEVIITNERRMLKQLEESVLFDWYEAVNPWDGTRTDQIPEGAADGGGLVASRGVQQGKLRDAAVAGYYGGGYGGASPLVQLTHAEVQTLRAAFPDLPLFVVKLDLQDYYPSIRHDVLLEMLRRFGFPEEATEFCRRFLAVPLGSTSGAEVAKRGVPMDHVLSSFLAETLLKVMERHVHRRAKVRILRLIDDICLLSPASAEIENAYRAVQEFLQGCGLRINFEKSGSLAMGAESPQGLPSGPPCWGMLELRADGSWGVHEPSFQAHWQQTRERVEATHSILERVSLYNANVRFLVNSLGIDLDLGEYHRTSINEAMRRFQSDFFAPGKSVVRGVREAIGARFSSDSKLKTLPESWLYWPITAGGLSLRNLAVLAGQFNEAFSDRQKNRTAPPGNRASDWQFGKEWNAFYAQFVTPLEPKGPKETPVMKTLLDDFIKRGSEVSAGKQKTLSEYWRWVLAVYGPEILEKFGTFRFLITDLVPLQLIHERLLNDSSLSES